MNTIGKAILIALIAISPNRAFAQNTQSGIGGPFKGPLAAQLWSFRNDFSKDVPGTLKRVRELGFTYVELAGYYGMTAQQFRAELDKAGLKAVSMHIDYRVARDKIDDVIRDAKILGVQDVGVPWIKSPFSKADCVQAIEVFNRAGARLAAGGLRFFYHLHGYEFVPNEGGQGTLFDLLMASTDPRFVSFQLDTYHVVHPGQDPAKLLKEHPGRFLSLHLKDIRTNIVGDSSGGYNEKDERPLGQGKINWPEVLRTAQKEGVKWYIIENETTDVWKGIPESLRYLETVKY